MSDKIIGPNPCHSCGGEYGEHTSDCQASGLVYLRDHSFYANSHGGSAGRYHFMGEDLASACGLARMLDDGHPSEAASIPEVLRCRAKGCREKWPMPPSAYALSRPLL